MTLYGYGKLAPGGSSTTKSWTRACDVGNTIVLIVQHQSTGNTVATVSDSAGNTWTKAASTLDYSTPGTGQQVIDMWVCVPTTAITTINFSASAATYWVAQAKDYAGANTIRSAAKYVGSSGNVCAVTGTTGDTLILGVAYTATTGGTTEASLAGYTADGFNNISSTQSEMWEKTATTTGTQTPNVSITKTIGVVHAAIYTASANVAPSVSAGSTQTVVSGTAVSLTATATDSDGTVSTLTAAISGPTTPTLTGTATGTGTASASLTQTATLSTPGVYTWTATATDNSGASTPASTTIYVYAASGVSSDPLSVTPGTWSNVGGAATALAAITDTNTGTYLESPAGPTSANTVRITLPPQGPGALTIYVEGYYNAGTLTRTLTLFKADGTTAVDTTSYALPSADAEQAWNPSITTIPAVTDRQALILQLADA
jgi:hypothetical protein